MSPERVEDIDDQPQHGQEDKVTLKLGTESKTTTEERKLIYPKKRNRIQGTSTVIRNKIQI